MGKIGLAIGLRAFKSDGSIRCTYSFWIKLDLRAVGRP